LKIRPVESARQYEETLRNHAAVIALHYPHFLPDSQDPGLPDPRAEFWKNVATLLDAKAKPYEARTLKKEVSMKHQEQCVKVRLMKPTGEITVTQDFDTSTEAESRYARLVEASVKDRWLGARVQCLDASGGIVHEHVISK
jgi:hypothetical protein